MSIEQYTDFALSGRLVRGHLSLRGKTDDDNKPVMDRNDLTKQVMESYMVLAIHKSDPQAAYIRQLLTARARQTYGAAITGECTATHPRFAFKIQDGDGADANGTQNNTKEGYAGHWVITMATRMSPKCYLAGKYQPHEQLPNPDDVIKLGYYVRVIGSIKDNGVAMQGAGSAVPGLFVSHSMVELLAPGTEITVGQSAVDAFGKLGAAALPVGAQVNQTIAANMPAPPAMNMPAPPAVSLPSPPAMTMPAPPAISVPAPPQVAIPAPPPAGPTVAPAYAAQGITWAGLQAQGWTEDVARQHGYIL